jgi:uncharacterized protein (DUF58 family)
MKSTFTLRWLLAGLFIFCFIGWAVTGLLFFTRLTYLCLLIVFGARIWTYVSMHGIRLNRKARILRARMGDVFEENLEVRNTSWLPCLWLEIINQSNLPKAGGSRMLTGIGPHQRRFYTSRTMLYKRGAFLLGPTNISSGDPLGLFLIRRQVSAKETLLVLPMTTPIKIFPPPPGILPGGRTIQQRTFDVTPHAAGVREYIPSDPMKRIHWPSTAHRGRFMVKEFEQDPQADIWLFIDAQREIQASLPDNEMVVDEDGWWLRGHNATLPRDSFEYVVSAAASLANYFLMERKEVGMAYATGRITFVSADRGERQVNKIMETLAFIQADGVMPINGLVTMMAKLLPLGSSAILITPSNRPELLLAVDDLQRHNLRPVVVLVKPETFGGVEDSNRVISGLIGRKIPVCTIGLGDDLSHKLVLPVIYFQRQYQPKSLFSVGI